MAMTSQTSLPVPVSRARGPAGRAIEEPDERMLVHAQALFDVPLREGARRKMHSLGVPAQARDSRIVQADAERMTHVVHCSAARYIVNPMCSRPALVSPETALRGATVVTRMRSWQTVTRLETARLSRMRGSN